MRAMMDRIFKNKVSLFSGLILATVFASGLNSPAFAKHHHDDDQKEESGSTLDNVINGIVSTISGGSSSKEAKPEQKTPSQSGPRVGSEEDEDPDAYVPHQEEKGLPRGVAAPVMHKPDAMQGRSIAVVRVLNRVTSQSTLLEIPVGKSEHFGRLTVEVSKCLERPSDLPYDSVQYLKLKEDSIPNAVNSISGKVAPPPGGIKVDEETKQEYVNVYSGWFLAREPGATAYPSALFDVHAVRCKGELVAPILPPLPSPQVPNISSAGAAQGSRTAAHKQATQLIPEDMQDEGDQVQDTDGASDEDSSARESLLPPMPTPN